MTKNEILDFLINFVYMKKSLNYLPEPKRRDLRQLVEIIRDEVKDTVMIILYGSYARDTYVDYDQRTEFGVRTCYMSDYDILILTHKAIGAGEHTLFSKINNRFFIGKNRCFYTNPQFVNYSIADYNHALDKRRYFETDIKRQGIMLYDNGEFKLARRRKLNFSEIKEMAKEYFDEKYPFANRFLSNAKSDYRDGELKMSSFNLHQATENYMRVIPMVYALYGYKDHNLAVLSDYCKRYTLELANIFLRDTPEEERLFKLLQDAYVQARYNKNFVVTKRDLEALIPKIERLRDVVEKLCLGHLEYYTRMIEKEQKTEIKQK